MTNYSVQGKVISKTNNLVVPFVIVEIFEVDPLGSGNYAVDPLSTTPSIIKTGLDGKFNGTFDFPGPSRPDIIFRLTQKISGIDTNIYNEIPAFHTRWNIGNVLYVNIKVEENCITYDPSTSSPGERSVFTRVGNIGVNSIGIGTLATGGPTLTGYGNYDTSSSPPNSAYSNLPFGGTLWIGGWFGKDLLSQLKYYKIQYRDGVHNPSDPDFDTPATSWHDISDPLANNRYDFGAEQWVTESMGPTSYGGIDNLYRLPWDPFSIPWTFPDLLTTWDTTKIVNLLYTLRLLGYKDLGGGILEQLDILPEPSYGTLKLMLDNSPPVFSIIDIKHNGSSITPCTIVKICSPPKSPEENITVYFKAYDPKGHLSLYRLVPYYGHNQSVFPPPPPPPPGPPHKAEDDYSTHVNDIGMNHKWLGLETYETVYKMDPPQPEGYNDIEMPTCAYQFRLRVDKRTTNGYGLVYWGYEDNYHFTIERDAVCP